MPTVKQLLSDARLRLTDTETPSLDARLLLQHATGLSHADLIANDHQHIADGVAVAFNAMVSRRQAFEPVSRILGTREFYGRSFKVTPDVLDPRADTETIVAVCLTLNPKRILDLGTGSGILAVTVLAEIESATGIAVDVSPEALAVAAYNAGALEVADRLTFIESSWFSKVEGRFDLIVSNPPYIPARDVAGLDVEVRDHDPHLALAGGADGLDCYRAIATGAALHLVPDGGVVVEIGAGQAADVTRIFAEHYFHLLEQKLDLGGHIRALRFCFGIE